MEFSSIIFLSMAAVVFSLLLLVQLPSTLASDLGIQSKVCGTDHVAYLNSHGYELFYINGDVVDKDVFCKALKVYYANNCVFEGHPGSNYCGLNLPLVELPANAGRKILRRLIQEESTIDDLNNHERETKHRKSASSPKVIAMAVPGILVLCCSLLCPCFRAKRKETDHAVLSKEPISTDSISSFEVISAPEKVPASPLRVPPSPSRFSISPKPNKIESVHLNMNQIARATNNFSPSLKIGEGGFGTVYKAQLQDGQVVAIKRAKKELFENLKTEFRSEVELLAKIDHRNLVKLLGYVDKGNERLIITEFVPNGTLREHLDGQRGKILDFNQRLEISIDVAHALTYLHLYAEKQIIHRDVKSSNILLTESFRAKVADFGFARLGPVDAEQTHISTKVKGTVGYLDPEYMRTYQLTPKSDVYSFGILLIEILTGRRPVELRKSTDEKVTLRWAFKKYNEGNVVELGDPLMEEVVDTEILNKMFGLAIQCAAPIRSDRPDMKSVGEQLWGIRMDYVRSVRRG
ncbi:calmodulin-binding receptor-like cytoplasmic kinase 3 isoform X1 [Vitis riparia]|uniref:calmodulin-binding receptor-like cytoplasmic kinase 3 isoform X1 n=1 Tax=Vitis riparia TaxID=96939 RepID=UPI00155AC5F4|nr:calmodulin-binding receptor-like cytoplasmic kinase 3 isoform X1 [Vitis riparia]